MPISVVITTYNRASLAPRAIRSVLTQPDFGPPHEIVVVDDASVDKTVSLISSEFFYEIETGILKIIQNPCNLGVTGSKNVGYEAALGGWVVFLDSDDVLISNVWNSISAVLNDAKSNPIVFFRCIDQDGNLVGTLFENDIYLGLREYLVHTSHGEALTAINKDLVKFTPYLADLRGYEGLGCCRMIRQHGAALLSTIVARCYDQTGGDRLSVSQGLLGRISLLSRGHRILVREFGQSMGIRKRFEYRIKGFLYYIIGAVSGVIQRLWR